jgi:hypothetical protein
MPASLEQLEEAWTQLWSTAQQVRCRVGTVCLQAVWGRSQHWGHALMHDAPLCTQCECYLFVFCESLCLVDRQLYLY